MDLKAPEPARDDSETVWTANIVAKRGRPLSFVPCWLLLLLVQQGGENVGEANSHQAGNGHGDIQFFPGGFEESNGNASAEHTGRRRR